MNSISDYLNELSFEDAESALQKCCASKDWVKSMLALRPFKNDGSVDGFATEIWWALPESCWREAFAAHPRIGDVNTLRAKFGDTKKWAEGEQAGAANASDETLEKLAKLNRDYVEKYKYIFIVCATGKTADEMLEILESRIDNDLEEEIKIAAAEQLKITLLRLNKLKRLNNGE